MIIPIIIPTGYNYTCTVEGSSFKIVQCEQCRFVYVYKMTRTAVGQATAHFVEGDRSADIASANAQYQLNRKFNEDCDAVPCLECGKYQPHMVDALKHDFMLGTFHFAIFAVVAGVLAGAIAFVLSQSARSGQDTSLTIWAVSASFFALGAALLVWRRRRKAAYEPNATDLAERLQIAAKYGKSLDDFKDYLKIHGMEWELPRSVDQ